MDFLDFLADVGIASIYTREGFSNSSISTLMRPPRAGIDRYWHKADAEEGRPMQQTSNDSTFRYNQPPPLGFGGGMDKACPAHSRG